MRRAQSRGRGRGGRRGRGGHRGKGNPKRVGVSRHDNHELNVPAALNKEQPNKETKTAPTSRLCVKNLPIYLDDKRLKEIFSKLGPVTDVKIMRTRRGMSRKFGFVGYRTVVDAEKSASYFNNSFIDTSRISVEFALPPNSSGLERPWSKYSEGSSAYQNRHPQDSKQASETTARSESTPEMTLTEEKLRLIEGDEKFKEFLSVMKGRNATSSKFWANDAAEDAFAAFERLQQKLDRGKKRKEKRARAKTLREDFTSSAPAKRAKVNESLIASTDPAEASSSDDEEYEDLPANSTGTPAKGSDDLAFLKAKSREASADAFAEFDDSDDSSSESEADVDKVTQLRGTTDAQGANSSGSESSSDSESEGESEAEAGAKVGAAEARPTPSDKSEEALEEGRLFVRNLPFQATEHEVKELFSPFGALESVHISLDASKNSKGFGYIMFTTPDAAAKAMDALDGTVFQGRLLHVLPGRKRRSQTTNLDELDDDAKDGITYKKKKDLTQKAKAGDSTNWNSLFVRSDTVAEAMAKELGVKKSELLEHDSSNMATRLALAETHVINETRQFLTEHGVVLQSFSGDRKKAKRSDAVILVKNLPFACEELDLTTLFGKFGDLGRVVLAPSRVIAIVEFLESQNARRAFRSLAYTKFKNTPLYLEWAPLETFARAYSAADTKPEPQAEPLQKASIKAKYLDTDEAEATGETSTLFVKNLNFETKEADLEKTFSDIGPVRSATIMRKKNPGYGKGGREGHKKMLSMGYGFVEFKRATDAAKALKTLQNVTLDGHQLVLKVSNRQASRPEPSTQKTAKKRRRPDSAAEPPSSKLIVKNVPFEATAKEIRELFSSFGQIKRCRLPKKFDGGHRGFAFVDFATKQEAKNAADALQSTHLYGRHLVLQWAKEDEDVEDIREKTKQRYTLESKPSAKGKVVLEDDQDHMEF